MNEQKVKEILGEAIEAEGGIYCLGHYMAWKPGEREICLDSYFTLEELEAIVCVMKNH